MQILLIESRPGEQWDASCGRGGDDMMDLVRKDEEDEDSGA